MTDQPTADTEPTTLRMAQIELRHLRAEVARLRPFVAVADGASRAAEHWEAETKRWLAFIERGMETHMRFGVIRPDGSREELPCADWCYACRVEKAEAAVEAVAEVLADHNGDEWSRHPATQAVGAAITLPRQSGPVATAATEPAWRPEDHARHGSPCERTPDGSCSAPTPSPAREQIAAVIREFPFDDYGLDNISYALADNPDTQEWVPALADAVLAAILPGARITAGLARDSEATVQRVIDLHERWTQTSPPLGTSMTGYFQWWREHLAELHDAILPPEQPSTNQTKEQ